MSEIFVGYECQYCKISSDLFRKCTAAVSLEEKKKPKISEVRVGLEDAEALIRKNGSGSEEFAAECEGCSG